jgi:hypothetical protein
MRGSKRSKAISKVFEAQPPLDAVTLWKFPRCTFADWIDLGMGEAASYDEYLERLREAEVTADEHGLAVLYCTKTPVEVAAWMESEGLDRTDSAHRAEAIGVLALQNEKG